MSLKDLKNNDTDRQKILTWLKSIGADQDEIDEVIAECKINKEARAYYVGRYDTMGAD